VVASYRDEVPVNTPYALPACVTQSGEPPRWFDWQEAIAQAQVQVPVSMTATPRTIL